MFSARSSFVALAASLSFTASTLSAEEVCAGLGEGAIWLGGGAGSSDVATSPDYLEQMALVLGSAQYLAAFSLSDTTDVRIEAAGRGNGDPVIDVFNASGTLIATDDDSGGEGNSRIESRLDAGTYCIALRSFEDAPMTAFIRTGRLEQEALTSGYFSDEEEDTADYGDACTDGGPAQQLVIGETAVNTVADVPAYRFSLYEPMAITITATNEDADPLITLYSADGAYLGEDDDTDGLNPRLSLVDPQPAGDYCLSLRALNDDSLPVEVLLEEYDATAAARSQFDNGEAAPPLDGSYPIDDMGLITTRKLTDVVLGETHSWIKFDTEQSGLMVVEAIGISSGADPKLRVFDDLGREIGFNDDNGPVLDSFLAFRVMPGSYLAAIGNVDSTPGARVRVLVESYLPAR